ncbi:adapter protein MecA 1 [Alicyclobacillus contaminans]|uniref:adaptor protein MecA n=1 Tax=Alicyclobacillus contaminans TaxID=392016 RepID=UPI0004152EE5|nr:adaptor protein MecA [Alicyclobacillus contaminans]GMA52503.1 adapter protein MecA 1 [Alicyclobacillus contaminans]
MRVERIAKDKVRFFISYDDLEERGIDRDEIWQNGRKVQELFWDMMEAAYEETGFEVVGPISVEAFTMPTEGVVVIVTRVPSLPGVSSEAEEDDRGVDEMAYSTTFVFRFKDFEDVVRAAHLMDSFGVWTALYAYEGQYYLYIDESSVGDDVYMGVWAVLHEYGEYSEVTKAVLDEYGTPIFEHDAVHQIVTRFPLS